VPVLKFSGKINLLEKKTQKLRPTLMILSDFPPAIQTSIQHFANPDRSLTEIGSLSGISKQAAAQIIALGGAFFASYGTVAVFPEKEKLGRVLTNCSRYKHNQGIG
jgi:hypothetical protein